MKDAAKKLMALFSGLERAYGIYRIDDPTQPGKKKGSAITKQDPVTEDLWKEHLDAKIQLGIVPIRDDATCTFGAIDVDDYKTDHAALEQKIKKAKLPLIMCRSKSGGAHLYGFFSAPVAAEAVRELLSDYAAALGYGNVEIFPKQNKLFSKSDTGNWINMPYCGGDESERHAIRDGKPLTVDQFLAYANRVRIEAKHFEKREAARPELLEEGPPCLMTLCGAGFPEGTRNSGLFALGVYAKRRWPGEWEQRLHDLNEKFMTPPLEQAEVIQIAAHLQRKDYSYRCTQPPIAAHCQRSICIKRKFGIGPADAQDVFGLALENVVRLETNPPVYFADFNGKRVRFNSEDINSQSKMRDTLIKQANDVIQPVPQPKWYQFMAKLTAGAVIAEAPPETSRDAQLLGLLEDYCLEQVEGRSWEDVIDGQTFEYDGRIFFRYNKFIQSVNKEHHMKITTTEAYTSLIGAGVKSEKRNISGKSYTLWSMPSFQRPDKRAEAM